MMTEMIKSTVSIEDSDEENQSQSELFEDIMQMFDMKIDHDVIKRRLEKYLDGKVL